MTLATQFVPAVVIILPFFVIFRDLGLLDMRIGLILVNLAIVIYFLPLELLCCQCLCWC